MSTYPLLPQRPRPGLTPSDRLREDVRDLASRLPDIWGAMAKITGRDGAVEAALAGRFQVRFQEECPFTWEPDTLWLIHHETSAVVAITPEKTSRSGFAISLASVASPPLAQMGDRRGIYEIKTGSSSAAWYNFENGTLALDISIDEGRRRAQQASATYPALPFLVSLLECVTERDDRSARALAAIIRGSSIPDAFHLVEPKVSPAAVRRMRGVEIRELSLMHVGGPSGLEFLQDISERLGAERMPRNPAEWWFAYALSESQLWHHALQHRDWRNEVGAFVHSGEQCLYNVADFRNWAETSYRALSSAPEESIAQFRSIGIRRMYDLSERWHRMHPRWNRQVQFAGEEHIAWEPLCNPEALAIFAPGWTIKELCSAAELEQEGFEMQHCVADYVGVCRAGESRIFSILSPLGARATMELSLGGDQRDDWSVAQCLGVENSEPSRGAATHASGLLQRLTRERSSGRYRLLRPDYAQRILAQRGITSTDPRVIEVLESVPPDLRQSVEARRFANDVLAAVKWEGVRERIGEIRLRRDLAAMLPFVPPLKVDLIPRFQDYAPPANIPLAEDVPELR